MTDEEILIKIFSILAIIIVVVLPLGIGCLYLYARWLDKKIKEIGKNDDKT